MNDFDYDVMQKKNIARSAFNRKSGARSKACTLPSDHMTDAQWKKRNGKEVTYDLKIPLNWTQFTDMPADIQKAYLQRLVDKYHVTITCLSDLFGVKWNTLDRFLKKNHAWLRFKRGAKMSAADKAGFAEFLCGAPNPIEQEEETIDSDKPPAYNHSAETQTFRMRRLSAEFETPYDPASVGNMVLTMMPTALAGVPVRIRFEIDIL